MIIIKSVMTIIFVASMVLSVVGNICTCAVVFRDRTMRTPTNCYLVNLAITDLAIAIFIPLDIYIIWFPDFYPLGEKGCRVHFLLWDSLSNSSVLTILAFTVERYLVISRPFMRHTFVLSSRVFKIITVNWIIAGCFCIINIFYVHFVTKAENVYCFFKVEETLKPKLIFILSLEITIFFILPMTVITILYILIALKLRTNEKESRRSPVCGKQNKNRAVKMLAAVAASFFVCWSPYCILRVMMIMPGMEYGKHYNMWITFIYLCCVNGYVSTAVNPVLYNLMSQKFRKAFKDLLKGNKFMKRTTGSANYKEQGSNINNTGISLASISVREK